MRWEPVLWCWDAGGHQRRYVHRVCDRERMSSSGSARSDTKLCLQRLASEHTLLLVRPRPDRYAARDLLPVADPARGWEAGCSEPRAAHHERRGRRHVSTFTYMITVLTLCPNYTRQNHSDITANQKRAWAEPLWKHSALATNITANQSVWAEPLWKHSTLTTNITANQKRVWAEPLWKHSALTMKYVYNLIHKY